MIAPEKVLIDKYRTAQGVYNASFVLKNNQDVRNKNYNPYGKNNYWEFTIPEIDGFNAMVYSPLVYMEIPELERGTLAYDDFWDEQDRRCIEGFEPVVNGVKYPRITGPHYFYLNMVQIMMKKIGQRGAKTLQYPYYRVLDHLMFLEIEKAEILGYGLIIGKARRMGLSYMGDCMIMHKLLFSKDNEVAIGAGKKDKAMELYEKVKKSLENLRPEYQVSYKAKQTANGAELWLGRTVTDKNGNRIREGIGSKLTVKTFHSDPSAFEGGSYSFFIFEEIGLQDNLIKSYKASEPCFMDGAEQFGVPMLYGTGGEVDKGSRDMKIIYEKPEAYNMKKIFIPAYLYYPGSDPESVDENDPLAELEQDANFFDPVTGRTDQVKALEHILKRRKLASTSKDGYIKEVQSRPTEEAHLFLKTKGGQLNRLILNGQLQRIYDKEDLEYVPQKGRLEWVYPPSLEPRLARCINQKERDRVHMTYGSTVKFEEDPEGTVYIIADPLPHHHGLPYDPDIMSSDSYDEEVPENTGSMGASLVYRLFNGLSRDYNMPVALVYERGDSSNDDTFYSNTLKMSVYYNAKNGVEYSKINLIHWYVDTGAEHLLMERPALANQPFKSPGQQRYGHQVKGEMPQVITKLLKQEVNQNCKNIWLDLIILDLIEYGEDNTDIAMAYGGVLLYKLDLFDMIFEDTEEYDDGDILMDMEFYTIGYDGNIGINTYGDDRPNELIELETFDPRKHLHGEERENYINFMQHRKQKMEAERASIMEGERARKESDPFQTQIENELRRKKEGK